MVKLCTKYLNYATMQQYQQEERSLIARRYSVRRSPASAPCSAP